MWNKCALWQAERVNSCGWLILSDGFIEFEISLRFSKLKGKNTMRVKSNYEMKSIYFVIAKSINYFKTTYPNKNYRIFILDLIDYVNSTNFFFSQLFFGKLLTIFYFFVQ